jgi:hypothetical protein
LSVGDRFVLPDKYECSVVELRDARVLLVLKKGIVDRCLAGSREPDSERYAEDAAGQDSQAEF